MPTPSLPALLPRIGTGFVAGGVLQRGNNSAAARLLMGSLKELA